ncbi:hypothetical protein H0N99_02755 [Candidatus Micrarchaeota archaeon]|nr:hypothetical protein [Candidatus Micrarchaeota archaeon]
METAEILEKAKKAMGVAGIVCGAIGIIAAIVMYFVLSPLIDRVGATAVVTMDHAASAVHSGVASLNSASNSISSLSEFSGNMSAAMVKLENGSSGLSSSLSNLSKSLGAAGVPVPNDSLEQLNDSANSFSEFSAQIGETRPSLSSLSSYSGEMASNINSTRDSVAGAESDISEMKDIMNEVIRELKLALLVGTFIVVLLFLTLMCYSAGILL